MQDYPDPRARLAEITDRFKEAHAAVVTYKKPAFMFIGEDSVRHLADLEELMGILCARHDIFANIQTDEIDRPGR
jgi:hypothetical protein